ncbi:MAG TPA: ABC transporter permease [Bacillota bacterium]
MVWRRLRRDRFFQVSLLILMVLGICAVFGPQLARYGPIDINVGPRLAPPSAEHWMGTDHLGRDVFSRILHGARISLALSMLAMGSAVLMGTFLGSVAGYFRRLDEPIMRVIDVLLAFPGLLRAIAVVAALGPGLYQVVIAVGLGSIPMFARYTRSFVLRFRDLEFVEAAVAGGASSRRILVRHILPNCVGPILVMAAINFASAVTQISILSFLGLGVQPPVPEWGAMAAEARQTLLQSIWPIVWPSLAIFLTVLSLILVSDSLQEVLDPRLQ